MNDNIPASKRGSKSIGEDRLRDAAAKKRQESGLAPLPEPAMDEGRSSGHGPDGPPPAAPISTEAKKTIERLQDELDAAKAVAASHADKASRS